MRGTLVGAASVALLLMAGSGHASFLDKLKGAVDQVTTGSASGSGAATSGSGLATDQIVAGLKEALRVGAERVLAQVGAANGFNGDPAIHIPLPEQLTKAQDIMRKFGMSALADDVELKINRAAEEAAPKTKALIWKAVNEMTLDDAKKIYDGPTDAATQYFKRVATPDLKATIEPVVNNALQQVGAISAYDTMISKYKGLPLVPDVKADLQAHATQGALDGIFHYLAKEEASIRANPAARTTDILKTVFGGS
jgi:hypothetical protein